MLAGALELQIAANLARLTADMGSARGMINDFAKYANTALATIGVAGGATGLVLFAKHVNDATAEMKDFGKEAGTSAEAISRFDLPARAAGSSLGDVANAIFKVSKSAVEARDPSSQAALALSAIGLSAKDLKNLKSDEMFELLARRINTYSDGVEKNAAMQILFGKSGREMNKVISDIAETSKLAATVTNEQAEEAQKLNRQIIELKMNSEQFWRSLISSGVPALNEILKAFMDSRREAGFWQGAIAAVSAAFDALAGTPLQRYQKELSAVRAEMQAIAEAQAEAARSDSWISSATKDDQAKRLAADLQRIYELEKMISALQLEQQDETVKPGGGKPPPKLDLDAAKRASLFKEEMAQLEQERAKLEGVSEVTLYVMKLGGERYKLLFPDQKKWLEAMASENASMRELAEQTAAYNRVLDDLDAHDQAKVDHARQMVEALDDENERQAFENTLIGKSAEEQRLANVEFDRMIALRGVDNEQIREAINARYDLKAATIAQGDAMQRELSLWNQVGDAAGKFFDEVLLQGKSAFDSLKALVKQLLSEMIALFAKRWVLQLAAGATGSSALGAAAQSAGTSSLVGGVGSAIGSYISGLSVGGTMVGGFADLAAGWSGASMGIATGAMEGATWMTSLGASLASIPVVGWIALAALAAYAAFGGKGGGPKGGGSFAGNFDSAGTFTGPGFAAGTQNGRLYTPATNDAALQQIVTGFGQSFAAGLAALGGTSTGVTFGLGYDTDPNGRAGDRVSSVLSDANGRILYQNINASSGADLGSALTLEAQRALLAALQAADLPQDVADILNSVVAAGATSEDIQRVIASATEMANVLKAIPTLDIKIDVAGLRAMAQAGESIGQTFTRLATTLAQFDDAFMSDAQKIAKAQKEITDGFNALGIAIPADKNAFYDLVHSLDLTTEAGRAMFATLMALAPAFLVVANAADQVATAVAPDNSYQAFNYADYLKAMQEAADAALQLGQNLLNAKDGLKGFVNGLLLNAQLSPLTLDQRFMEAEHQYQQLRDAAKGGDLTAYGPLQGATSTYLSLARELFAGADYNAIYRSVVGEVGGVAGISQQQINDRLNGSLPPQGATLASSGDIARVESAVLRLLDRIANGTITVSDPETKQAVDDLKDEVTGAARSGGVLG